MNKTKSALQALAELAEGNAAYRAAENCGGDGWRERTALSGQTPYAVILTCSDSRVIPEKIFHAEIGDLFVIRVAGNVIDSHQLGSIEYALSHLGCRLVVVLGHTHCGAVEAAAHHDPDGYIKFITDEIRLAIGEEKDGDRACALNAKRSASLIAERLSQMGEEARGVLVMAAVYRMEDGSVEFLEER